jgi:hypothetical protein
MSITVEEKEQLYKEFKERMIKEQESRRTGAEKVAPARDYFNQEKERLYKEGKWTPDLYAGWEGIRKLACRVCDVKYVNHLEPKHLDIANDFAIEVIKLYFEAYEKALEL